jgi:glucan phosphorylase
MRPETKEKYRSIQKRFSELYSTERLRIDDCEKRIAKEYFITLNSVRRILKIKIE